MFAGTAPAFNTHVCYFCEPLTGSVGVPRRSALQLKLQRAQRFSNRSLRESSNIISCLAFAQALVFIIVRRHNLIPIPPLSAAVISLPGVSTFWRCSRSSQFWEPRKPITALLILFCILLAFAEMVSFFGGPPEEMKSVSEAVLRPVALPLAASAVAFLNVYEIW